MTTNVFVVKDDYDQETLCVVKAENEDQAIDAAKAAGFSGESGDLWALEIPYLEAK